MKTAAIVLALALGVSCDTLGGHAHHAHAPRSGRQEAPLEGYAQPAYGGDLDTAASDAGGALDGALEEGRCRGLLGGVLGAAAILARRRVPRTQPQRAARSIAPSASAARRAFEGELGVTLPLKYWDPLGLSTDGDAEAFRRRRVAEIKNGRVAMLACMGYIAPEYFRWPGYLSPSQGIKFADLPNGVAALTKMPAEGWGQIGVFIAFLELFPLRQEPDRAPGDAPGCGRLGVPWFFVAGREGTACDPAASERSLNAEINNGRLAMVAITGMVAQNGFLGTTGPEMWLPASAQDAADSIEEP